jgi:hypothetical protein
MKVLLTYEVNALVARYAELHGCKTTGDAMLHAFDLAIDNPDNDPGGLWYRVDKTMTEVNLTPTDKQEAHLLRFISGIERPSASEVFVELAMSEIKATLAALPSTRT